MKLGTQVKCKGYLSRIKGLQYIYANKEHFKKTNSGMFFQEEPNFYLEDMDEYKQETMKIINKNFEGIVVERKKVSTANFYTQASESIFDPVTFGYVDERYLDAVRVEKDDYMDCYKVYYAMGKSRLVPIHLVEEVNDD